MNTTEPQLPKGFIKLALYEGGFRIVAVRLIGLINEDDIRGTPCTVVTLALGQGKTYTSSYTLAELLHLIAEAQA